MYGILGLVIVGGETVGTDNDLGDESDDNCGDEGGGDFENEETELENDDNNDGEVFIEVIGVVTSDDEEDDSVDDDGKYEEDATDDEEDDDMFLGCVVERVATLLLLPKFTFIFLSSNFPD